MDTWPTRSQAEAILEDWTKNQNLRKHAYAVEAAMRAYAARFGQDPEKWGAVGLLHDFDYEKFPSLSSHPMEGAAYLRQQGFSDELVQAILAHADHAGVVRDSLLKKAIYAVDELTGLITAAALVRPSKKLAEVEVKTVMKKWKEKSFAAGVNRQTVEQGSRELGVPLEEHVGIVLKAMQGVSAQLGL
ncbi:MAG: HDIG domain-containing metalloprotein [Candidatus Brocadiia bacterium]|jgi:putative nucleotidyltransferase with HDIG domain